MIIKGNTFLVIFSEAVNRDELTKYLDKRPEIEFWFYNLPNSIFIKTQLSAKQLSELIESQFGQQTHFVARISDSYGRLPPDHWPHF